jgi:hypothetical protein
MALGRDVDDGYGPSVGWRDRDGQEGSMIDGATPVPDEKAVEGRRRCRPLEEAKL